MKINCFILLIIYLLFAQIQAFALEVVYPKKQNTTIYAKSTFFIGNTLKNAELTINGEGVKVWGNGSFVQVVPLNYGLNTFLLKSSENGTEQKLEYIIKRPEPTKTTSTYTPPILKYFNDNKLIYAKVKKNNSPVRTMPNSNATRVTHLNQDIVLFLEGSKSDFYKIKNSKNEDLWIFKDNVEEISFVSEITNGKIYSIKTYDDKYYNYMSLELSIPVLYKIKEIDTNTNELTLYGIIPDEKLLKEIKRQNYFDEITLKYDNSNNTILTFKSKNILWGYSGEYNNQTFIFKQRKTPEISYDKPLKNITIIIDAGHGGNEKGAIGPTNIPEKDINLSISKYLSNELIQSGANVIMTRNDDSYVDLYDRVKISKNKNALFSLSIHCNALPDGQDPYIKHGTGVYYFNNETKLLANTIKQELISATNFRDDGTNYASFVMTRETDPLSVLIETAYLINPEEYILLLDSNVQKNIAQAIRKGLEKYLITNGNLKN